MGVGEMELGKQSVKKGLRMQLKLKVISGVGERNYRGLHPPHTLYRRRQPPT